MSPIHAAMVALAPSLLTHTIVFAWKDFEELIVKNPTDATRCPVKIVERVFRKSQEHTNANVQKDSEDTTVKRSSSVIRLLAKMVAPVLKTVGDTHVPVSQASKESIAQSVTAVTLTHVTMVECVKLKAMTSYVLAFLDGQG